MGTPGGGERRDGFGTQVVAWMKSGLEERAGMWASAASASVSASASAPSASAPAAGQPSASAPSASMPPVLSGPDFHMRFMGRAAKSGAKQALFTFFGPAEAEMGFEEALGWWVPVPLGVDARGRRKASVRWYMP